MKPRTAPHARSRYPNAVLLTALFAVPTACHKGPPSVTPSALVAEAHVDRAQAHATYAQQRVSLHGTVAEVGARDGESIGVTRNGRELDPKTTPLVSFAVPPGDRVLCLFLPDAASQLGQVRPGSEVWLSCEFQEYLDQGSTLIAVMTDCYIESDYRGGSERR